MKKTIMLILIVSLLTINFSYAEMIDESYINLIFDNFNKYTEKQKAENTELLEVLFSSTMGLDLLYSEVIRTKADALKAHGVSEAALKRNIDILKSWSKEDRLAFLEAGVSGDYVAVNKINSDHKEIEVFIPKEVFTKKEKPILNKYDNRFTDTNNHWSKEHVVFLSERGIISGKSESSFAPDDNIKKSEIIALVMNVIIDDKNMIPAYKGRVSDIQTGMWYDESMQNGQTLKLIKPNSDGDLLPNLLSTREEVVEILIKSLIARGSHIDEALKIYSGDFSDFENVDPQYRESMVIAVNLGFIGGMGDGRVAPKELITRGQTAVVIKKLYTYLLSEF